MIAAGSSKLASVPSGGSGGGGGGAPAAGGAAGGDAAEEKAEEKEEEKEVGLRMPICWTQVTDGLFRNRMRIWALVFSTNCRRIPPSPHEWFPMSTSMAKLKILRLEDHGVLPKFSATVSAIGGVKISFADYFHPPSNPDAGVKYRIGQLNCISLNPTLVNALVPCCEIPAVRYLRNYPALPTRCAAH